MKEQWALFARDVQKNPRKCEVTMYHELDGRAPGVKEWFRSTHMRQLYAEIVRTRIYALEMVVNKWDIYYGPTRDPKKLENRK